MEAVRESVKMSQTVLEESLECNVESSVIVPDKNPDILKILQVDTTASIDKKIVKDGRLTVEGRVYADVIYLADNEEGIKTLPVTIDFSDFFDSALISSGMHTIVSCDVEEAQLAMINSRKVTLRVSVGISAEVIADIDAEYISSISSENADYKTEEIKAYLTIADDDIEFLIKEETEISSTSSPIAEIIKCDCAISDKEVRVSGTKVIVKGAVTSCLLYKTTDGEIECTNARFPFTEVFELGEEVSDEALSVSINIIEKSAKECGERSIRYQFLIRIEVVAKKEISCNAVSDCYFFGNSTLEKREELHIESTKKLPVAVKSVREIVSLSENMPKISSVYNVVAKPNIISLDKTENGVSAIARLDVSVLYLSDSKENPICCLKSEIAVPYTIEKNENKNVVLDAQCEHISYALTGAGDVEIRASVAFSGEEKSVEKINLLTGVEKGEDDKRCEIVIFFASGGENLWDIGKKYSVCAKYIAELNEIEEGVVLEAGRRLIIPV